MWWVDPPRPIHTWHSSPTRFTGVSLAKVVDEFTTAQLKPPPSVNIAEVENCTGFACGADCDITVSMA